MTQPASSPQSQSATPTVVWEHAAELALLEDQIAHRLTAPLRLRLTAILRTFRARLPDSPVTGFPAIRLMAELAADLRALPYVDWAPARMALASAWSTGVRQAAREAGVGTPGIPMPDGVDDVAVIVDRAAQGRAKAIALAEATAKVTPATVTRIVSVAQQEPNQIEVRVRTAINQVANEGIGAVADAIGARKLWIAERDACRVCLALSGHFADEDGFFDDRASFGAPMEWVPLGGLTAPPRHGSCRCRTMPWLGDNDGGPNSLPMALRREAERSVLHGWALPSESVSNRRYAAARFLRLVASHHGTAPSGWQVPASVRTRTGRRINRGTFTTERFPGR